MTDKDKRKILKRQMADVCCPGCGEEIGAEGDLSTVEYVRTYETEDGCVLPYSVPWQDVEGLKLGFRRIR